MSLAERARQQALLRIGRTADSSSDEDEAREPRQSEPQTALQRVLAAQQRAKAARQYGSLQPRHITAGQFPQRSVEDTLRSTAAGYFSMTSSSKRYDDDQYSGSDSDIVGSRTSNDFKDSSLAVAMRRARAEYHSSSTHADSTFEKTYSETPVIASDRATRLRLFESDLRSSELSTSSRAISSNHHGHSSSTTRIKTNSVQAAGSHEHTQGTDAARPLGAHELTPGSPGLVKIHSTAAVPNSASVNQAIQHTDQWAAPGGITVTTRTHRISSSRAQSRSDASSFSRSAASTALPQQQSRRQERYGQDAVDLNVATATPRSPQASLPRSRQLPRRPAMEELAPPSPGSRATPLRTASNEHFAEHTAFENSMDAYVGPPNEEEGLPAGSRWVPGSPSQLRRAAAGSATTRSPAQPVPQSGSPSHRQLQLHHSERVYAFVLLLDMSLQSAQARASTSRAWAQWRAHVQASRTAQKRRMASSHRSSRSARSAGSGDSPRLDRSRQMAVDAAMAAAAAAAPPSPPPDAQEQQYIPGMYVSVTSSHGHPPQLHAVHPLSAPGQGDSPMQHKEPRRSLSAGRLSPEVAWSQGTFRGPHASPSSVLTPSSHPFSPHEIRTASASEWLGRSGHALATSEEVLAGSLRLAFQHTEGMNDSLGSGRTTRRSDYHRDCYSPGAAHVAAMGHSKPPASPEREHGAHQDRWRKGTAPSSEQAMTPWSEQAAGREQAAVSMSHSELQRNSHQATRRSHSMQSEEAPKYTARAIHVDLSQTLTSGRSGIARTAEAAAAAAAGSNSAAAALLRGQTVRPTSPLARTHAAALAAGSAVSTPQPASPPQRALRSRLLLSQQQRTLGGTAITHASSSRESPPTSGPGAGRASLPLPAEQASTFASRARARSGRDAQRHNASPVGPRVAAIVRERRQRRVAEAAATAPVQDSDLDEAAPRGISSPSASIVDTGMRTLQSPPAARSTGQHGSSRSSSRHNRPADNEDSQNDAPLQTSASEPPLTTLPDDVAAVLREARQTEASAVPIKTHAGQGGTVFVSRSLLEQLFESGTKRPQRAGATPAAVLLRSLRRAGVRLDALHITDSQRSHMRQLLREGAGRTGHAAKLDQQVLLGRSAAGTSDATGLSLAALITAVLDAQKHSPGEHALGLTAFSHPSGEFAPEDLAQAAMHASLGRTADAHSPAVVQVSLWDASDEEAGGPQQHRASADTTPAPPPVFKVPGASVSRQRSAAAQHAVTQGGGSQKAPPSFLPVRVRPQAQTRPAAYAGRAAVDIDETQPRAASVVKSKRGQGGYRSLSEAIAADDYTSEESDVDSQPPAPSSQHQHRQAAQVGDGSEGSDSESEGEFVPEHTAAGWAAGAAAAVATVVSARHRSPVSWAAQSRGPQSAPLAPYSPPSTRGVGAVSPPASPAPSRSQMALEQHRATLAAAAAAQGGEGGGISALLQPNAFYSSTVQATAADRSSQQHWDAGRQQDTLGDTTRLKWQVAQALTDTHAASETHRHDADSEHRSPREAEVEHHVRSLRRRQNKPAQQSARSLGGSSLAVPVDGATSHRRPGRASGTLSSADLNRAEADTTQAFAQALNRRVAELQAESSELQLRVQSPGHASPTRHHTHSVPDPTARVLLHLDERQLQSSVGAVGHFSSARVGQAGVTSQAAQMASLQAQLHQVRQARSGSLPIHATKFSTKPDSDSDDFSDLYKGGGSTVPRGATREPMYPVQTAFPRERGDPEDNVGGDEGRQRRPSVAMPRRKRTAGGATCAAAHAIRSGSSRRERATSTKNKGDGVPIWSKHTFSSLQRDSHLEQSAAEKRRALRSKKGIPGGSPRVKRAMSRTQQQKLVDAAMQRSAQMQQEQPAVEDSSDGSPAGREESDVAQADIPSADRHSVSTPLDLESAPVPPTPAASMRSEGGYSMLSPGALEREETVLTAQLANVRAAKLQAEQSRLAQEQDTANQNMFTGLGTWALGELRSPGADLLADDFDVVAADGVEGGLDRSTIIRSRTSALPSRSAQYDKSVLQVGTTQDGTPTAQVSLDAPAKSPATPREARRQHSASLRQGDAAQLASSGALSRSLSARGVSRTHFCGAEINGVHFPESLTCPGPNITNDDAHALFAAGLRNGDNCTSNARGDVATSRAVLQEAYTREEGGASHSATARQGGVHPAELGSIRYISRFGDVVVVGSDADACFTGDSSGLNRSSRKTPPQIPLAKEVLRAAGSASNFKWPESRARSSQHRRASAPSAEAGATRHSGRHRTPPKTPRSPYRGSKRTSPTMASPMSAPNRSRRRHPGKLPFVATLGSGSGRSGRCTLTTSAECTAPESYAHSRVDYVQQQNKYEPRPSTGLFLGLQATGNTPGTLAARPPVRVPLLGEGRGTIAERVGPLMPSLPAHELHISSQKLVVATAADAGDYWRRVQSPALQSHQQSELHVPSTTHSVHANTQGRTAPLVRWGGGFAARSSSYAAPAPAPGSPPGGKWAGAAPSSQRKAHTRRSTPRYRPGWVSGTDTPLHRAGGSVGGTAVRTTGEDCSRNELQATLHAAAATVQGGR